MRSLTFFIKTTVLPALLAIIIVCCKTTKTKTTIQAPVKTYSTKSPLAPDESDVAIAKTHWPATNLDTLNLGYYIYATKCTDCHSNKKPQDFGIHEWWVIMHQMGRKAKLTGYQDSAVLHYLLTKREAILGPGK